MPKYTDFADVVKDVKEKFKDRTRLGVNELGTGCVYSHYPAGGCAIGCLIDDEALATRMDAYGLISSCWRDLPALQEYFPTEMLDDLAQMQHHHDMGVRISQGVEIFRLALDYYQTEGHFPSDNWRDEEEKRLRNALIREFVPNA